jgi:acyl-CoA thioester hydrolase
MTLNIDWVTSTRPFEITVSVFRQDIDEQNHVNNIVYLRWVQEVAIRHWQAVASPATQAKIAWVVLRHEIDYKAPSNLGDDVALTTWVGTADRLTFERLTNIRRASDRKLLARARTLWVPINAKTGKPTRVPPEVRACFSVA